MDYTSHLHKGIRLEAFGQLLVSWNDHFLDKCHDCYRSVAAAVSGPEWAVQAAAMEEVEQALAAEAVEVWPGLELLKTQHHKD